MIRIKRFNESSNFNDYFKISDEDILDISLEMTDMGFEIKISNKFVNSDGSITNEPVTETATPICNVQFSREYPETDAHTRYDGSYYYNDIDVIKTFTSTLNKMKMLDIKDSYYNISNDRYTIRLIFDDISLSSEKIGFDLYQFNEKISGLLRSIEISSAYPIKCISHSHGGKSISFELFTNGIYSKDIRDKMWLENDEFDNKDQYKNIIKLIEEFLGNHSKFIRYRYEFEPDHDVPYSEFFKKGLFKKIKKTYNRYSLYFIIKVKE